MEAQIGATSLPAAPQRNWFERNWKWFVPTGCLSLIVLFLAFVAGVFGIVEGSFKSSSVYTEAMARAQASSQVSDNLGRPIRAGWFVSGAINIHGDSGDADISIPISGPKGKGTAYVVARKVAGIWEYKTIQVEVDGQPGRIDLLQSPLARPAAGRKQSNL